MRHKLIALSIALGMLFLGCAEERPTSTIQGMATLNLSDDIVSRVSPATSVAFVVDSIGKEFGIHVADSEFAAFGANIDIYLECEWNQRCQSSLVEAWDYRNSNWTPVQLNNSPTVCIHFPGSTRSALRPLATNSAAAFFGPSGFLKLRGAVRGASAQLASVHPDYNPILVSAGSWHAEADWVGDALVTEFFQWESGRGMADSLVWWNREGTRIKGVEINRYEHLEALIWTGSELWGLATRDRREFALLSANGEYTPLFEYVRPEPFAQTYTSAAVWVEGRIWIPYVRKEGVPEPRMAMMVIDPYRSVVEQQTVYDTILNLDNSLNMPGDMTYHNGTIFMYTTDHIVRLNLNAEIIDSLPLPVRAMSIASDGDALWIVHQGPPEAYLDMALLSRFYVK